MGQINLPSQVVGAGRSRLARYSRRFVSVVALAASLAALALIVHNQHGWHPFRAIPDSGPPDSLVDDDPQSGWGLAAVGPAEEGRHRAVADFVARRYRVSQDMAYDLVRLAHSVGHQNGLDPLLIVAIIAVESRFNPIAESGAGAKGLMQIIPKYHPEKLEEYGGEKAVFDPVANVKVGSQILKEYLRLTGNMGIALQMYAGALGDGDDQYTTRVMNEQQRLKQAASPAPSRVSFNRTPGASPGSAVPLK